MVETIIAQLYGKSVVEGQGKQKGKWCVQIAGTSDKGSKAYRLQVWDMPFDTREEASKTLKEYQEGGVPRIMFVRH